MRVDFVKKKRNKKEGKICNEYICMRIQRKCVRANFVNVVVFMCAFCLVYESVMIGRVKK